MKVLMPDGSYTEGRIDYNPVLGQLGIGEPRRRIVSEFLADDSAGVWEQMAGSSVTDGCTAVGKPKVDNYGRKIQRVHQKWGLA